MAVHKSILSGLEQTGAAGASQFPLGDTDWLLTNWELPQNSLWSRAPPGLSSAGLVWLKARAEAAPHSCHALPGVSLSLLSLSADLSSSSSRAAALQPSSGRKKKQPQSRICAFLVAAVLCHCVFTNQSSELEAEPMTAVEMSGPQLLGSGCHEPAKQAEHIYLPDSLVLLLQFSVLGGGFILLAAAALSWPHSCCWGSTV